MASKTGGRFCSSPSSAACKKTRNRASVKTVGRQVAQRTGQGKTTFEESGFGPPKMFGRGRPSVLDDKTREEILDMYFGAFYSLRDIADEFGVSRMCVWRAVQNEYVSAGGALK